MLPITTLPGSWLGLLSVFRSCFTAPTFTTFTMLVSGMVARPRARTVTGMLIGAGMSGTWHHSRAHRFFGRAVWSADDVSMVLLALIVRMLIPAQAGLLVAVDDTLFTRSGKRVAASGWHHDAASKTRDGNARMRWGHCWVVAGLVVDLPMRDRPVCLPVAFALWVNTAGSQAPEQSKQALAARLVAMIASACPGRHIDVVADCWYAGMDGAPGATAGAARHRGLPQTVTLTSRLRANAALTRIATPVAGAAGRPKRIGERIGTPKQLAAHPDTVWRPASVSRYGCCDSVSIAETVCLWYGVYRSRAIRVILLRDDRTPADGYGIAVITTDLNTSAEQIITRYAARWSIEVAFADAKQTTGVGQARNRTRTAVDRTVPIGLITQSLVQLWYTAYGSDSVTTRRTEAPWYQSKTRPAYLDMIVQLRHTMIAAKILDHSPHQPTPQQIHDVTLAWEQAAA